MRPCFGRALTSTSHGTHPASAHLSKGASNPECCTREGCVLQCCRLVARHIAQPGLHVLAGGQPIIPSHTNGSEVPRALAVETRSALLPKGREPESLTGRCRAILAHIWRKVGRSLTMKGHHQLPTCSGKAELENKQPGNLRKNLGPLRFCRPTNIYAILALQALWSNAQCFCVNTQRLVFWAVSPQQPAALSVDVDAYSSHAYATSWAIPSIITSTARTQLHSHGLSHAGVCAPQVVDIEVGAEQYTAHPLCSCRQDGSATVMAQNTEAHSTRSCAQSASCISLLPSFSRCVSLTSSLPHPLTLPPTLSSSAVPLHLPLHTALDTFTALRAHSSLQGLQLQLPLDPRLRPHAVDLVHALRLA